MPTKSLTNRNDTYTTSAEHDLVLALDGDDRITVGGIYRDPASDLDDLEVRGGDGNDRIVGQVASGQFLLGEDGNDTIEVGAGDYGSAARGGKGNDVLRALDDGGGSDGINLFGDQGNDTLYAADNADSDLNGGTGRDMLVAGDYSDEFEFFTGHTAAGANRDVIKGFAGFDRIDLGGMDADKGVAGDQAFAFVGATRNPGTAEVGYYRRDGDTIVVGDDGRVSFEVELDRFTAVMDAGDFFL